MSCSNCNRPCIRVGGKCVIAIIRQNTNLSFAEAWEGLTNVSISNNSSAFVPERNRIQIETIINKQHKLIKQFK